jgi:XTP/dITP diphosphohydrolase
MNEIVVATMNTGKVAEIAAALAMLPVTILSLRDFTGVTEAVENGDSFAANAALKAAHYSLCTGKPCLADDSGLEVDALHGAPGVYSARYAGGGASDAANNRKLLADMTDILPENRSARFCCVLAYVDPDGTLLMAEGTLEGAILREPKGNGGFGYDPLFLIPALEKTMAEISLTEKNAISHRGQAMQNMATKLVRFYNENRSD